MNFLPKSLGDLSKIQFDMKLMLTEQRAQRVDLARVIQLVRLMVELNKKSRLLEPFDEAIPTEETEVD